MNNFFKISIITVGIILIIFTGLWMFGIIELTLKSLQIEIAIILIINIISNFIKTDKK